jgi:hypothetical protein
VSLSCRLLKIVEASTYVLPAGRVWPLREPSELLAISSSDKKGPAVPRLRLRPVRFGTVIFNKRLLVVTAVESNRFANGSSGRSETEMSCLSSSSFSPSVVPSGFDRKP